MKRYTVKLLKEEVEELMAIRKKRFIEVGLEGVLERKPISRKYAKKVEGKLRQN